MTHIDLIRYLDNGFRCNFGTSLLYGYWDQTMKVIPHYHDVSEIIDYTDISHDMRIAKFIKHALE